MTRIVFVLIVLLVSFNAAQAQSVRSYDGSFNNVYHPEWGSEGDQLRTITTVGFGDGISEMTEYDRPNPREISNAMFSQNEPILDLFNLSDFVWVFGQFIDHDISLVEEDLTEPLFISIPENDQFFDPAGSPISMFRSAAMPGTGTNVNNPRGYSNGVTAFIDGSSIYGSDQSRARWLRTYVDGKLKVSDGNLLPWNTTTGEFNDLTDRNSPFMSDGTLSGQKLQVAGDTRANENPLLLSFHTLFVREHNRLCDEFKAENANLSDEELYQKARKWVGAYLQSITYNEWLPSMGITLPTYSGYHSEINPQISNVFSAAAFRMGHTLVNSNVLRLMPGGEEIPAGSMLLKDAFFNPKAISLAGGIEPYLRGMASQVQQKLDCRVIDDVRNFLFGGPSSGGMDLAAININRGRERGLTDFNSVRGDIGLPRLKDFSEITKDVPTRMHLMEIYTDIDNIDPWVGMLAEDYMPGAIMGSTLMTIIEQQFQRLRDGDRFYYEADRAFTEEEKKEIASTTMRDIIMRNTTIEIMQKNVFEAMSRNDISAGPELAEEELTAVAYPNPTDGRFTVKVLALSDHDIVVKMFDLQGKLVSNRTHQLVTGENFLEYDISDSYEGAMYNLVIEKDQIQRNILRVIKR